MAATDDGWVVALFKTEQSVEAVPVQWTRNRVSCFWPPQNIFSRQDIIYLIKQKRKPDKNWEEYEIDILGVYGKLENDCFYLVTKYACIYLRLL